MEGKTIQKNVKISPKKGRLLIPEVRGKSVTEAKMTLDYLPHRAADILKKCIHTAASNYIDKAEDIELSEDDLYVDSIRVDEGQKLKRVRPMSFGRAGLVKKRRSHITVIVKERGE